MEYENTCTNCDHSRNMDWNSLESCRERNGISFCDKHYGDFILRRDKRSCENCGVEKGVCFGCPTGRYEGWKPITEEKQMKEYKPTSKLNYHNLVEAVKNSSCSDVKTEFSNFIHEYLNANVFGTYYATKINSIEEIKQSSTCFEVLTKTEKRRNWLSEHGFIEEEIKYKCYTIDYMSYNLNIKTKVEFNGYIDDEDEDTLFFKLDNGKAFNIDKDLITNIKPKTPF